MNKLEECRNKINDIDKLMLELFEKRMDVVKEVALYKKENGLEILNSSREKELIEKNLKLLKNDNYKDYYTEFEKKVMELSKEYQKEVTNG